MASPAWLPSELSVEPRTTSNHGNLVENDEKDVARSSEGENKQLRATTATQVMTQGVSPTAADTKSGHVAVSAGESMVRSSLDRSLLLLAIVVVTSNGYQLGPPLRASVRSDITQARNAQTRMQQGDQEETSRDDLTEVTESGLVSRLRLRD